jgi:hypothetical protein
MTDLTQLADYRNQSHKPCNKTSIFLPVEQLSFSTKWPFAVAEQTSGTDRLHECHFRVIRDVLLLTTGGLIF